MLTRIYKLGIMISCVPKSNLCVDLMSKCDMMSEFGQHPRVDLDVDVC